MVVLPAGTDSFHAPCSSVVRSFVFVGLANKRLCPRCQSSCRSFLFVFHCQLFLLASTSWPSPYLNSSRKELTRSPCLALLSSVHVGLRLFNHNCVSTTSGIHAACSNRARLWRPGCGSASAGIRPAGSCAAGSPAEHQAVCRNLKGAAARNAVALDGVAGAQGASLPPPCVVLHTAHVIVLARRGQRHTCQHASSPSHALWAARVLCCCACTDQPLQLAAAPSSAGRHPARGC